MFIPLLIASFIIILVALAGVITTWKSAGKIIERNLHLLVSFAAGVFVILALHLSREVIEEASTVTLGLMWIILGLIATSLIVRLIPHAHHHETHEEHPHHTRIDARRILISDSFHNIGDGILIAAAFLTSLPLGITATVSIIVHEIVQEISEFFVLRQAGYSTRRALKFNVLTASTILIGSVGGYFLLDTFEMLEVPVLGIAAGALLAVLLQDLIPHSIVHAKKQKCLPQHVIAVALGVILMFTIFHYTEEFHGHGEEGGGEHTEELLAHR